MAKLTAFCGRCNSVTTMKDPKPVKLANGKPGYKGLCTQCKTATYVEKK